MLGAQLGKGSSDSSVNGSCYCGSVSFSVFGPPILSAYCHCTACQRLSASPFIHTIHFADISFAWTHAKPHEAYLDAFIVPAKPWKKRWRCKCCGGSVASQNSKTDRWSVWGTLLERDDNGRIKGWEAVKPTAHMFYGTHYLEVDDGLGKWEGYESQSARIS